MNSWKKTQGFTIPEVIIAGTIMIILCVGILTAYSFATRMNRGNHFRMQALAVLQREVEYYRSLKFVQSDLATSAELNGTARISRGTRDSSPGDPTNNIQFTIFVTIDNDPLDGEDDVDTSGNDTTKFKQIRIEAIPVVEQSEGWLQNLGTEVTIQRVRAN